MMSGENNAKPLLQNMQKFMIGSIYTVAAAAGVLTLRKAWDIIRRKYYNFPPGPVGIPIWGKTHDLGNKEALIKARLGHGQFR